MELEHVQLPERALRALDGFMVGERQDINDEIAQFRYVKPRPADSNGDVEVLDGVEMTHHFVQAPGESETIGWHYVDAGKGEPVVFLHGLPDSWYLWHHQLATLSQTHHVIAVDLKGYGQSEKRAGDYRHEGVSEQLLALLNGIGVDKFNLVTHDRGTVAADYLVANHPDRVLRYARGEQHLYHFNPILAPQEKLFSQSQMMLDPTRFVIWCYKWATAMPVPDADIERTIEEYSYPGISQAVPRYFNSSTFRKEWIDRRTRLLNAWMCPVLIMQGYYSKTTPRELYEHAREYIPNAKEVSVAFIKAGHFWTLENPEESTKALVQFLTA